MRIQYFEDTDTVLLELNDRPITDTCDVSEAPSWRWIVKGGS